MTNNHDEPRRDGILVVTGPTASGKSALAVQLAEELDGEIVNADSVQVYRGFTIGSGAPSATELGRVPHHLFGVRAPEEDWNAGLFRNEARRLISEIRARGRVPVIAGGTGLYVRSLLAGLVETNVDAAAELRLAAREDELRERGRARKEIAEELHAELRLLDPNTAKVIPKTDYQRVRRALLVSQSGGSSLRELQLRHGLREHELSAVVLCLLPEREVLYRRIDERVEEMLASGFLDEVSLLLAEYSAAHSSGGKPLSSIGYKQAVQFLRGEIARDEFIRLMKQETRRFAKRQETWWRHQPAKVGWEERNELRDASLSDIVSGTRSRLAEAATFAEPKVWFFPLSGVGFPPELG